MPQMVDPNFSRAVVLLCKHNDDGAFGLIVNRPLQTTGTVTVSLDPPVTPTRELQVWLGGPVELERSWILVGAEPGDPALMDVPGYRVGPSLYLSTSPDLLRRILEPNPPARSRLVVGYAGWGPGQLEAELNASAWLIGEADQDLIFDTPAEEMWEKAIRRLGADPSALQMSRGVH